MAQLLLQFCSRCLWQRAPLLQWLIKQSNTHTHTPAVASSKKIRVALSLDIFQEWLHLQGVHWGISFDCFFVRINSCADQIVTAGNTSLGDDLGDTTVVLRMNKKIMKFMHIKYPRILKQRFPTFGTVITVADNEQDDGCRDRL